MFLGHNIKHDVMAIAKSYKQYPGEILHWAMVDGNVHKWWAEHLPLVNNGGFPIRHTLGDCEGFDTLWDDGKSTDALWYGSSALFATLVALSLGYEQIVLAGCPMDNKGHWYFCDEYDGPEWREEDYRAWREFSETDEAKKVSSMSGFTKEVLS